MNADEALLFRGHRKATALLKESKKMKREQARKDWWSNHPKLKNP